MGQAGVRSPPHLLQAPGGTFLIHLGLRWDEAERWLQPRPACVLLGPPCAQGSGLGVPRALDLGSQRPLPREHSPSSQSWRDSRGPRAPGCGAWHTPGPEPPTSDEAARSGPRNRQMASRACAQLSSTASLIRWSRGLGRGTVWRGRPAGGQGFSEEGWLSPRRLQEAEKGRWAGGRAPGAQGEARLGGGKAPDVPLRWWAHLPRPQSSDPWVGQGAQQWPGGLRALGELATVCPHGYNDNPKMSFFLTSYGGNLCRPVQHRLCSCWL